MTKIRNSITTTAHDTYKVNHAKAARRAESRTKRNAAHRRRVLAQEAGPPPPSWFARLLAWLSSGLGSPPVA